MAKQAMVLFLQRHVVCCWQAWLLQLQPPCPIQQHPDISEVCLCSLTCGTLCVQELTGVASILPEKA
jgi:hypothetical protein